MLDPFAVLMLWGMSLMGIFSAYVFWQIQIRYPLRNFAILFALVAAVCLAGLAHLVGKFEHINSLPVRLLFAAGALLWFGVLIKAIRTKKPLG